MTKLSLRWAESTTCFFIFSFIAAVASLAQSGKPVGIFEGHGDIGTVLHEGSVQYDRANDTYTVSGSGETTWSTVDEFQYVWKKTSGDVSLQSDVALVGSSGDPHRKAMLMIRQSLDPSSPYVGIAIHAVGKTSLQFRAAAGHETHTIASNRYFPHQVRLVKRGDSYYAFITGEDGRLHFAGSSTTLHMAEPFYVGIGVCAHEKDAVLTVHFSNVKLVTSASTVAKDKILYSTLETIFVGSGDRQIEYTAPARFEAPNWSPDGLFFVFNRDGNLWRLPVKCGGEDTGCAGATEPLRIAVDPASHCNNDHGLSSNGRLIAMSCQLQEKNGSVIYIAPIVGGVARQITPNAPSYWHGWSPNGKTLAFTGQRNGDFDIYSVPATGGDETQLTKTMGLDDGPEYSPDGQFIYFHSERTGQVQIWRMKTDGSDQEQVLSDETNDWFPHISPDGQWMVFLSYRKDVSGHPPDKEVTLNLMSMKDKKVRPLATLFGGQGTIDTPSWSPDSKKVAFISYKYLSPSDPAAN